MKISDLTVEVRNASLSRVGQILPADLVGMSLALRYNRVGSWKVVLRSDHPLVDSLRAPGAGLIVTGPSGVLISGPTLSATNVKSSDDPTGSWEIVGTDDSVILGERVAYPVPTTSDLTLQTNAYDSRTGVAETVAKAYVLANMGSTAPAARKIAALTIDTDLGRGLSVVVNARFDKLGELLDGILTPSGLGFDIRQSGSNLVFEVYQPTDRSAYIRMDVDNQRLTKSQYSYTAPGATRVIVAGQGQGSARVLLERTSTDSLASESSWGRRIEVFRDARSESATAGLQKAGDEVLADKGFTVEGISVTPSDDLTSMRFGTDWSLGDKVSVVVGSATVAKVVTEVAVVVADDGTVRIGATVGDPLAASAGDVSANVVGAQTSQEARISFLERNDLIVLNDSQVTTPKIADSAVTSAKIADGTIVNADVSASAAIAVSKLAASSLTVNGNAISLGGSGTITASQITSGTLPAAQLPSGTILQAINVVSTSQTSTSSTTPADVSGLSIAITPRSSASRFLLMVTANTGYSNSTGGWVNWNFARSGTNLGLATAGTGRNTMTNVYHQDGNYMISTAFHYLDSPATGSAITYTVRWCVHVSPHSVILNRRWNDTYFAGTTTFTVLEIAG